MTTRVQWTSFGVPLSLGSTNRPTEGEWPKNGVPSPPPLQTTVPTEASRREFGTSMARAVTAAVTGASILFPVRSAFAFLVVDGPVTVIGANGKTGYECVKALQARGIPSRACTRQGVYRDGNDLKGVESMKCDVTDASTIEQAVKGASAVIFAASASKEGWYTRHCGQCRFGGSRQGLYRCQGPSAGDCLLGRREQTKLSGVHLSQHIRIHHE